MKKIIMVFTILLSVLCCTNLFAQTAPDTLWVKKYGFCGMNGPDVNGVSQTPDGGFLVLGSTTARGQGGSDFLLIRTDQSGDTLWTNTYGGTGNDIAFSFNSLCMTVDGGCVITGFTTSFGGGQSLPYCLRVNPQGDTLWTRVLSAFTDGNYAGARPIGSGFMLLGSYNNDGFLERVDSLGSPLWNVTLGIGGYAIGLDRSTDGSFLVSGRIGYPMSAAKVDTNGNVLWSSGYRGGAAYGVTACEDGGGVFVGDGYGFFTGDKFDAAGNHIWSRTYSGYYGMGYCALHLLDNSLVLGGYVPTVVPTLFKVSSSGDVNWSSSYPYLAGGAIEAGVVTSDYGFAFAGAFPQGGSTEGFLMKLGPDMSNVPPCPPTDLPFIDNFDSPELDSCWRWIREDTSRWSLEERSGWIRVVGNGNLQWPGGNTSNILLRTVPDGDLVIETRVDGHSNANSALIVYRDDDNFIDVIHNEAAQRHVRTHSETNGQPTYVDYDINAEPIYLRIEKIGTHYAVKVSSDGLQWGTVNAWDRSLATSGTLKVGMIASSDPANTPSDYDYFRVDSLPGTTVCGDVSGVWDSTGSPFYVTCDVTVPVGQTLEIQPGVQVLFTGHYKFNVLGNLQAIGTEQDSIVFTRAFPTEDSKWWGIRFYTADDTSRLSFCRIEWGKADGGSPFYDYYGGGVFCNQSNLVMSNCEVAWNEARYDGGGINIYDCSPLIEGCDIHDNRTTEDNGAGGGISIWPSSATISRCRIWNNQADQAGGVYCRNSTPLIVNCTISGNRAIGAVHASGGGISLTGGQLNLVNSIVFGNTATTYNSIWIESGSLVATYSDIEGGFPGTGNIDADPRFVDAVNSDFHLQWSSPCIDSGDPASPLDSVGTRIDMGAIPYFGPRLRLQAPNGGEQWRVFSSDTVVWSGTGVAAPIKIELNRHYPQNMWEMLTASTPNDGSEVFFISDPLSDSCRIRISTVGDVYKDSSAANFSIVSSQGYLALALQSQPTTPVISWPIGSHECPETVTTTYKLKNFGSENIVVFAPALVSGTHFNVSHDCPPFLALSPGQMSTYNVTLTYDPQAEGSHRDTLRMQTDAVNAIGGNVRIPLSGSQTRTPAAPQVVITIQGQDARLSWEPVTLSGGECPITVTEYMVFFSEESEGPFWYHGFTTDTTYVHGRVITHADGMFYHVVANTTPPSPLFELPPSGQNPPITEEQVLRMLRERRIAYEHIVD